MLHSQEIKRKCVNYAQEGQTQEKLQLTATGTPTLIRGRQCGVKSTHYDCQPPKIKGDNEKTIP